MSDVVDLVETHSAEAQRFLPVMDIKMAIRRRDTIVSAIRDGLLNEGIDRDYGTLPGTKKPTLLQPGADKLNSLFGLIPRFEITDKDLDWTGERHAGEPFFFYEVKCRLYRGDFLMGEGDGSANSWESKHRYRKSERVCPGCNQPAIIKGKAEFGGGWICFKKKGGCGAKYEEDDPDILEQIVGNIPNENIADVVNSLRKVANKRAKVAATLNALSAHEFFTQDMEDLPHGQVTEESRPQQPKEEQVSDPLLAQALPRIKKQSEFMAVLSEFKMDLHELKGDDTDYYSVLKENGVVGKDALKKMDVPDRIKLVTALVARINEIKSKRQTDPPSASAADLPEEADGPDVAWDELGDDYDGKL
jgi:hypothetical protein